MNKSETPAAAVSASYTQAPAELDQLLAALPSEVLKAFRDLERAEDVVEATSPEFEEALKALFGIDSQPAALRAVGAFNRLVYTHRSLALYPLLASNGLIDGTKPAFDSDSAQQQFEQALAAWLKTME